MAPAKQLPNVPGRRLTHFLYVGDAEPRKNLGALLDAYARYRQESPKPLELVLAGSADADGPGVRVERHPDARRLAELFAGAAALVHPSLYEGFGLTVLEAMRVGVPVIASRSVEELCDAAARYADPDKPETFAEAMGEIAARPALRAELWQRGRRRAAEFSWDACSTRASGRLLSGDRQMKMKIAILGTRGIPASYSGFETAVEQLASRLTARGHEVVVYCRPHVVDRKLRSYKGAELVHLRTVQNKYLDTFVHTLFSAVHVARATKPDVALFFIAGNSPLCLITRWASIPAVINVDGLDSDRRKWPAFAKAYLRFAERTAPRWADEAITDSHAVADILRAQLWAADRRRAVRGRGSRP